MKVDLTWQFSSFRELPRDDLYRVLQLRQQVFVVEQRCIFPDIDGKDAQAYHLLGWPVDAEGELLAYLRILPPGVLHPEPALQRIVTAASVRGRGVGAALMAEGIRRCEVCFGKLPIRISAQVHLTSFYERLGFRRQGEPFDEDGIRHVHMCRPASGKAGSAAEGETTATTQTEKGE